jgi:hypothetical protein
VTQPANAGDQIPVDVDQVMEGMARRIAADTHQLIVRDVVIKTQREEIDRLNRVVRALQTDLDETQLGGEPDTGEDSQ